jgi:integrase
MWHAVPTVTHLHAVLRKAFRDAVIVDELISSNPVERAKRPRAQVHEPGTIWTVAPLRTFLNTVRQHRLFAFFHVAAYTGARRGELLNLRWTGTPTHGILLASPLAKRRQGPSRALLAGIVAGQAAPGRAGYGL